MVSSSHKVEKYRSLSSSSGRSIILTMKMIFSSPTVPMYTARMEQYSTVLRGRRRRSGANTATLGTPPRNRGSCPEARFRVQYSPKCLVPNVESRSLVLKKWRSLVV